MEAARIARAGGRRPRAPTAARATWPARSGPGTKLPSLGHIRFAELRDAYEEQARGAARRRRRPARSSRPCYDLLQAKAAVIACRRAMAAAGRQVPIQLQVTMETTGRMLVGSEIGAALTAARRAQARRVRPQLRHRAAGDDRAPPPPVAATRPMPISVLPNAGLPSVVDGRTHYDLTPERAGRVPRPLHHRARRRASSAAAAAPRPSTCATSSRPCARPHAGRADAAAWSRRSPRSTRRCRSSRTPRS